MPGLEISLFLCSPPHKMFKEMERQLISSWQTDTLLTEQRTALHRWTRCLPASHCRGLTKEKVLVENKDAHSSGQRL